ncbi:MAG: hypothetical protein Q4F30_01970 [Akkermansia sp.]|nr:hypothetical protein [Akkermansia sp.]
MMKYVIPAVLGAATVMVAPAQAADNADPYFNLLQRQMEPLKALMKALEGVNDKATADSAAPKVKEIVDEISAIGEEVKQLGEPGPEVQAKLQEKLEANPEVMQVLADATKKIVAVFFQQEPCYGSQALVDALKSMMEITVEPADGAVGAPSI